MPEEKEVSIEEIVSTLSWEFEALINILEKKNLLSREEIFGELLMLKNEATLKKRVN